MMMLVLEPGTRISLVGAICFLLSGCGGGGGDTAGGGGLPGPVEPPPITVSYTGNSDPATVEKANAVHWASLAVSVRSISHVAENLWIPHPGGSGEINETIQGAGGGTAVLSGVIESGGDGWLEVDFQDYAEAGVTASGRYIQRYSPGGPIFSDAGPGSLEFDDLTLSMPAGELTLAGIISIAAGSGRYNLNLVATDETTGEVVYYENCTINFSSIRDDSPFANIGVTLSGTVNEATLGAVQIEPMSPVVNLGLFEPAGFVIANSGGFRIASAGTPIEFRALSRAFAALLIDADSDGTPDESHRVSWSELAGNPAVASVATGPIANAGHALRAALGFEITVNGLFSHDDGDWLTYDWRLLSRPPDSQLELDDPTLPVFTFVPDVHGDYVLALRVSNGIEAAETTVLASADPFPPEQGHPASTRHATLELAPPFIAGAPVTIDGRGVPDRPHEDPFQWSSTGPGNSVLTRTATPGIRSFSTDGNGLHTVLMEQSAEVTFPVGPDIDRVGIELLDTARARDLLQGDFDGDGRVDVALRLDTGIPPTFAALQVLSAVEGGRYVAGPRLPTGRGELAAGDLNGDGLVDFAVADQEGIYTSLQLGDRTFDDFVLRPFPDPGPFCFLLDPTDIGIGDIDGDGLNDLLGIFRCDQSLLVWRQQPDNTLAAPAAALSGLNIGTAAFSDFDGDGLVDAALTIGGGNGWLPGAAVAMAQSGGTFQVTYNYEAASPFNLAIAVGDTNGDGRSDVLTRGIADGLVLHEQQADGSFAQAGQVSAATGSDGSLFVADVDDDQDEDILVCDGPDRLFVAVRMADESFRYLEYGTCTDIFGSTSNSVTVMDFNGDGHNDVIASSQHTRNDRFDTPILLRVFLGDVSNYSRPVP